MTLFAIAPKPAAHASKYLTQDKKYRIFQVENSSNPKNGRCFYLVSDNHHSIFTLEHNSMHLAPGESWNIVEE